MAAREQAKAEKDERKAAAEAKKEQKVKAQKKKEDQNKAQNAIVLELIKKYGTPDSKMAISFDLFVSCIAFAFRIECRVVRGGLYSGYVLEMGAGHPLQAAG